MFFFFISSLFIALISVSTALPYEHEHTAAKRLPAAWYHEESHPAHKLFKRGGPGDGTDYAMVGSPTWSGAYPASTPDSSKLPQAWVNALNNAVASGKIPNIPQTHGMAQTNPVYPNGVNPFDPSVCSATYKCRNPGDIWDAPSGIFGTGFDDGPSFGTPKLLSFLQQQNIIATHFMIGINILYNPAGFSQAIAQDQDIAVHTWTHPYMTTLSNIDIVAQLGWTVEIIHNSTGGRLPRFWRPPYGDSDNRVRAIAQEVFGLKAIIWNQDSADWRIVSNGTTLPAVSSAIAGWLAGPKTPGLIVLEHELSDDTAQAFINSYPLIQSNGWQAVSVARAVSNGSAYQNSGGPSDSVTATPILFGSTSSMTMPAPAPSTTSSSAPSSTSSSAAPQNSSASNRKSNGATFLTQGDKSPIFMILSLALAIGVGLGALA